MSSLRTLQRLVLAGALMLTTGIASAGTAMPPPSYPSDSNDDTDVAVMIALGLAIASSINCADDNPLFPGACSFLGWDSAK